jgi:hypothetical protein
MELLLHNIFLDAAWTVMWDDGSGGTQAFFVKESAIEQYRPLNSNLRTNAIRSIGFDRRRYRLTNGDDDFLNYFRQDGSGKAMSVSHAGTGRHGYSYHRLGSNPLLRSVYVGMTKVYCS